MSQKKLQKRYQYWGPQGLQWSDWFDWTGDKEPYQLDRRLKNEYREV